MYYSHDQILSLLNKKIQWYDTVHIYSYLHVVDGSHVWCVYTHSSKILVYLFHYINTQTSVWLPKHSKIFKCHRYQEKMMIFCWRDKVLQNFPDGQKIVSLNVSYLHTRSCQLNRRAS